MLSFQDINAYIAAQPALYRKTLEDVRQTIQDAAPGAEESISYGMPAFKMGGPLVYFALAAKHIGFYPTPSGVREFREELKEYKTSKGAIQFPLDEPIPFDLIKKITEFRVQENREKMWTKSAYQKATKKQ